MFAANVAVRLWVALGTVADANDLTLGKPAMELLDTVALVCFGALREGREEATEIHPTGLPQYEGA